MHRYTDMVENQEKKSIEVDKTLVLDNKTL